MTLVNPASNNGGDAPVQPTQVYRQQDQELMNGIHTQLVGLRDTLTQMKEEDRQVMTMHVPGTWENIQKFFLSILRFCRIVR